MPRKGQAMLESMRGSYGPKPVHHSPFHGTVTGGKSPGVARGAPAKAAALAKEVASGLRSLSFGRVRQQQPMPTPRR